MKADGVLEKLKRYPGRCTPQVKRYMRITQDMIRGAELSVEDKEILLKLREKNDADDMN